MLNIFFLYYVKDLFRLSFNIIESIDCLKNINCINFKIRLSNKNQIKKNINCKEFKKLLNLS